MPDPISTLEEARAFLEEDAKREAAKKAKEEASKKKEEVKGLFEKGKGRSGLGTHTKRLLDQLDSPDSSYKPPSTKPPRSTPGGGTR